VPEPGCESDGKNFIFQNVGGETPPSQKTPTKFELVVKNATPEVVNLLQEGIRHPSTPKDDFESSSKGGQNLEQVLKILHNYQDTGAIKMLDPKDSNH
jgi:hypothetical protein